MVQTYIGLLLPATHLFIYQFNKNENMNNKINKTINEELAKLLGLFFVYADNISEEEPGRSDKIAALYNSVLLIKNLMEGKYHEAMSALEEIKDLADYD